MGFLPQVVTFLTNSMGFGGLSLICGMFLFIFLAGYMNLDTVYALALSGVPFVVYIMNLGNSFYWLLGVLVILYGLMLVYAVRKLISGQI